MKDLRKNIIYTALVLVLSYLSIGNSIAQLNGFVLTPSGTTDNFMKYVPKGFTVNGTNYVTGYLTLSAYKNLTNNQFTDPGIPVQKLQLQGGNILLCRTNNASTTPDINPTSRNGAILFSDMVTTNNNWIHGKWGIEYDDQYSSGGLNFFNPVSSITSIRRNFNLFIRNDGAVGIGTNSPQALLHVEGDMMVKRALTVGQGTKEANLVVNGNISSTSLVSGGGRKLVMADESGQLLTSDAAPGDNLGNHIAEKNLLMNNFSISYGPSDIIKPGDPGWYPGLQFKPENSLELTTGKEAYFAVGSGSGYKSGLWATSWGSGGYGLVLNADMRTGGIYYNFNNPTPIMNFCADKVGIGAVPPETGKFKLYVTGGIITEEVLVMLQSKWFDYVFEDNYELRTLQDVEQFIKQNKHLPDVPSESVIRETGINLGEMDAILLKKIEELTLYVIQLQKIAEVQSIEIKKLNDKLGSM